LGEEIFNVKGVLQRLVKWLNEQNINLDDPRKKKSHENKTLMDHVRECWDLSNQILKKLELAGNELKRFCFSLCIVHDLGKLDPNWQIENKRRPRHAKKSKDLLDEICKKKQLTRLLPLPNEYKAVLSLATLRHHSPLFIKNDIYLQREIRRFLSMNIPLAVNIADVIGVFKLADIASALDLSHAKLLSQYEWSKQLETNIEYGIKSKAEEKRGFDYEKYRLQDEIASLPCRHVIIAAPTGWGKTALSLLRVKHMKPHKVFYILPTITAIREFEQTLRGMFGSDYVGEYFYFADVEYLTKRKDLEESLYPIDFYRYFIPKIIITTIDQLLLATLQFGKYHLRRYNLRNSLLIFDEFHLLTPQMVGALKAIFETLTDIYNFSVLLMSATPSRIYANIIGKTLEKHGGIKVKILDHEYKRLRRHYVEIADIPLFDFLQENANKFKGKRILVISNTVDKAVQAYNLLKKMAESKVHLIHSRFAYMDRVEKEKEAKDAEILVSTQVAEVSLDISYDILITELAPIPSLIQRFGRVNRYSTHTNETNVYICTPESEKPYYVIEIMATEELLDQLSTNLKREGESVYLNILDNYYEMLMEEPSWKIENMYEHTKRKLNMAKYFYYMTGDFSKLFGREPSCLAVPSNYVAEVRHLRERMKGETYEKRRNLLANLKKYLISVPSFIIKKDGEWNEDLGIYTVGTKRYIYDPEIGLIKRDP